MALVTHPAPAGATYPPTLDLLRPTLDACRSAFTPYEGRTADQAAARVYVVPPPSYEWAGGDCTFICYAEASDAAPRTTSLGSG